jgi:acyl-CoA thioesterase FadM
MIDERQATYIGPLDPLEFSISEQTQAQYLEALEDYHLRYVLGQHAMPPMIHPGILLGYSNATRSPSFEGPNTQWVHLREHTTFRAAARLADKLIVRWRVEEHKEWLGRLLTRVSCTVSRDDGTRILDRDMWGLHSSPRAGQQQVTAGSQQDSGPERPTEGRLSLNPASWQIPGRQKRITGERIKLFSGGKAQNLHTSDAIAREAGLPSAVASAAQGMGYLCEFMIDNLGEGWLAGGSWTLTFRRPIFADDEVSAFGRLANVGPTACTIELRLVNQHGTATATGTASCHR